MARFVHLLSIGLFLVLFIERTEAAEKHIVMPGDCLDKECTIKILDIRCRDNKCDQRRLACLDAQCNIMREIKDISYTDGVYEEVQCNFDDCAKDYAAATGRLPLRVVHKLQIGDCVDKQCLLKVFDITDSKEGKDQHMACLDSNCRVKRPIKEISYTDGVYEDVICRFDDCIKDYRIEIDGPSIHVVKVGDCLDTQCAIKVLKILCKESSCRESKTACLDKECLIIRPIKTDASEESINEHVQCRFDDCLKDFRQTHAALMEEQRLKRAQHQEEQRAKSQNREREAQETKAALAEEAARDAYFNSRLNVLRSDRSLVTVKPGSKLCLYPDRIPGYFFIEDLDKNKVHTIRQKTGNPYIEFEHKIVIREHPKYQGYLEMEFVRPGSAGVIDLKNITRYAVEICY